MILSAGLTPAWQQILVFDQVRWGEVNRAREVAWCGSGKVLNAGMAVHRLGGPSLTLAPLGGLPLVEIEREFAALGVPRRWIETRAATRVCTTVLDRGDRRGSRNWWKTAGRWTSASWTPSAPHTPRRLPGPMSWCSSARCPAACRSRSIAIWSPARHARWSSISAATGCFRSSI